MQIQVWAHRGASAYAPENTMEAFALAVEQRADGIELDVHLSADGEVVVAHDETVDRVSDGTGRIVQMTLAELRRLHFNQVKPDYSAMARVPTLREVLDLLRPTNLVLNIELKNSIEAYPGMEQRCIDLVRAAGMRDRVWYSSFNHHSLKQIKAIDPGAPCGILYSSTMVEPWSYARNLGLDALHPHFSELLIPDEVPQSHTAGVRIHTWTVNETEHLEAVARTGVDAIITNFPDRALRVLGRA